MSTSSPLLTMRGIVKTFPGVRALDGVDLEVLPGEVHCLLGQNGAGKSTLIKVLSGAHRPDEGEIVLAGEPVRFPNPTAATRRGIATIYQELDLVDGLSVAENIFLGHEPGRREARRRTEEMLARLGHPEISPATLVGRLSPAAKQVVSIARALSYDARLIVMDEPSAALAHDEVANLFRIIGELTASGVSVVFITHRLDEIRQIGDRITVFKDGLTVARGLPADTATAKIVPLMTGRSVDQVFPPRRGTPGKVVLRVDGLALAGHFEPISFEVRAGEIVGLAGLVGSGRSEILETIYGARRRTAGRVLVDDVRLARGGTTTAVAAGMGLAPEERKSQGLLMLESVARNISLACLGRYSRYGWHDRRREHAEAARQIGALDLRPPDPHRPIRTLSGGNQQKAILGRWLLRGCRVLLLDEPAACSLRQTSCSPTPRWSSCSRWTGGFPRSSSTRAGSPLRTPVPTTTTPLWKGCTRNWQGARNRWSIGRRRHCAPVPWSSPTTSRGDYADYTAWIRNSDNGFVSLRVPFRTGTEVSVRTA